MQSRFFPFSPNLYNLSSIFLFSNTIDKFFWSNGTIFIQFGLKEQLKF